MNVIKEFKNDLLKRKELEVSGDYDSNPGYERVKEDLSKELKVDAGNISIKRLVNEFGSNEFVIELFIYDSAEDMEKIEKRNKKKEKKK
tara:strand:- start:268 stop:534 length:267 start_codon:yes stop_codon:yes gene_type:complete